MDPPQAEDEYELEVACTEKGNLCDPLQVQLGKDAVGKLLDDERREPSAPRGVVESAARGVATTTAAALHEGALFNLLTTRALVALPELPSAPPLVGVRKYNDALEKEAKVKDNTTQHQHNNTTTQQRTNTTTHQHNNTPTHQHSSTPTHQHTSTTRQLHDYATTRRHDNTTTQHHTNNLTHQHNKTPTQLRKECFTTTGPQHSNTGRGAQSAPARAVGRRR